VKSLRLLPLVPLLEFALLGTVACGGTPAELVVVVRSDLQTPMELALVRAVVKDAAGRATSVNDFLLDGSTPLSLPFSFGVVPAGGDASREIEVELTAFDLEREVASTRRARTGFVEDRSLLLEMFLARSCRTVECEEGETCGEQGCVSDRVPPGDLREVEPGEEI
jgi:hypothetical protein